MNIEVLENKGETLKIEIKDARFNIANLIRKELWNDKDVSLAAYEKKHPFLDNPKLIIKAKNPKKSLLGAVKRAEDQFKEFKVKFSRVVK